MQVRVGWNVPLRRYDPLVKRPALRLLGLLGFGALLAQAGHLIVYQLEFGAAAQAVQSQGAHAYFPVVAKSSLGIVAMAVLASVLLIGITRRMPGRATVVINRGPSYINLLSVMFTIQLVCFIGQEMIESLAAGAGAPPGLNLIFLGSVGQLPVAILGALAMKWLAVRVEAAVLTLRAELAVGIASVAPVSLLIPLPELIPVPALAETCPIAYIKRGPPAILRA